MKRRSFISMVGSTALSGSALVHATEAAQREHEAKRLMVVAWNVACGQWCTPQEVSDALVDRKPDLVLLNETPKFNRGVETLDWTQEIGNQLGLQHAYVGSISSANHLTPRWGDVTGKFGGKYKSILSRWPISNTHDYGVSGVGWSPASAVRVQVTINGLKWAIYSLHFPGHEEWKLTTHRTFTEEVLAHEPLQNVIVGGDFNVRTDSDVLATLTRTAGLKNAITDQSIDHILYKSDRSIRLVASGVDRGPAGKGPRGGLSDHPYAWADLTV